MGRTAGDIPMGTGNNFPPAGQHLCRCLKAEPWTSPNKHTPAVMLTLITKDSLYQFTDPVYVTAGAIGRLCLVARRLSGMAKDFPLPDEDLAAAKALARYILDNSATKDALVTIEEKEEEYIVQEGPDMGARRTTSRRRVAFGGYESPTQEQPESQSQADDDIPW